MKISIITATYNSAATVEDTLKSVAGQTYKDIEHLIIDGLSGDNTLEIVKRYPHVARVISEKDKGIYDAMNKGIGMASGDVVGILNSDDFYINGSVLEKVAAVFQKEHCEALYADLYYVDPQDTDDIVRYWRSGRFKRKRFLYGWMPPHPTFFVKRELYEKFGTFNTQLRSSADYELMLRFLYKHHCRVAYLPEVIVKMRNGGQSSMSLSNRIRANNEDRLAWKLSGSDRLFFTTWVKPIRKIIQFMNRPKA